jgi:L-threonylcarbamoyladenylate synthase
MKNNKNIVSILRDGGVAIFPTDTAFGIGCRIDNAEAVKRLFTIKKRSLHKPTPILISNIQMAEDWVDTISSQAETLMKQYWPGGLTIIVNTTDTRIDPMVTAGTGTVGIRMPNHNEILSVISQTGVPIIGSSANFEGDPTPYHSNDLNPELIQLVDTVMDGVCTVNQASTVVDCTKDPYVILREGAIQLPKL